MMVITEYPSIVKKYAPNFKACFSAEGYEHFQKAISGFMLSENKTLEAINRMFVLNLRHQNSFNKFFNRQNFDLDQVNQCRLDFLQQTEGTKFKRIKKRGGVLSIDNTLLKHYGHHFDKIYKLKDYVNDTYVWVHDLVTLHYSDSQTDYPIYYKLWEPADWDKVALFFMENGFKINEAHWKKRKKQIGKWRNYIRDRYNKGRKKFPSVRTIYSTKNHIAEDLLRKFSNQYPNHHFPVALDNGFTSAELCELIVNEFKMDYVGALRKEQIIIRAGNVEQTLEDFLKELKEQHVAPTEPAVFRKVVFTYKGEKKSRYAYFANHRIKGYKNKQRLVISFSNEKLNSKSYYTISNRLDW